MSVLQNSLFDYNTALSRFLEARRQQHPSLGLGFFPVLGSASGSDTTESLSPSPPAVNNASKSFTIDAILGLHCKSSNSNSTVLDYSNPSSSKKNNGSEKPDDTSSTKLGGKSKRVRTIFTPEQLERLEAEFERQQYMVGPERLYLAHTLQLTEAQVKVWFQNRRIKWRKQHLEMTQQRLALLKQHREQKLQRQQQIQLQINSTDGDVDDISNNERNYTHSLM